MKNKTRSFITLLVCGIAGLCITASAHAQSFLVINTSGCIQWIQIKNSNNKLCVAKALADQADATRSNAKGTGISLIKAGPTAALDDCCYKKLINASVSLDGVNWRIDINPTVLKVINRDTYAEVFSATGDFGKCVTPSGGAIGGLGKTQEPLSSRGQ